LPAAEPPITVQEGKVFRSATGLVEFKAGEDVVVFAPSEVEEKDGALLTANVEAPEGGWWLVVSPSQKMVPVLSSGNQALSEPPENGTYLIFFLYEDQNGNKRQVFVYAKLKGPGPPPDPPRLEVKDTGAREVDRSARIEVALDKPAEFEVLFDYKTEDGTAKAGKDYEQTIGKGKIPVGSSSSFVDVALIDDEEKEELEAFFLGVTDVQNAVAVKPDGVCSIVDDDEPQPSDLEQRVEEALKSVPATYLSWSSTFGAQYRGCVEEAKKNGWTASQMADFLKTRLTAPPITNEILEAWMPFWPAVIDAFVDLGISKESFEELSAAYLIVAKVLEGQ
jgi:hypothetical protein